MTARALSADEALAALQAAATARAGGDQPTSAPEKLGVKLPLAARVAAEPNRMIHVPICEADIDGYSGRPFDRDKWLTQAAKHYDADAFEHVHPALVEKACRVLADSADPNNPKTMGNGMVRWTYDLWAGFARCCRSTIHKIIRGLWLTGQIRVGSTFFWVKKDRRRGANLYFPTMLPEEAQDMAPVPQPDEPAEAQIAEVQVAETEPQSTETKAIARLNAALRDLGAWFPALVARAHGINTTPQRQERRFSPA